MNLNFKIQSGYIAITVSVILSILVLAVAIALGSSNLLTRSDLLIFNSKLESFSAARSCLSYALLRLAENGNYGGNETIYIYDRQCSILALETSGQNKIIKSTSQVNGATTNLKLTVLSVNLSFITLEELSTF